MLHEILEIIETLEVITELVKRMALFGNIRTFESNSEDWTQYIERLDYFFKLMD